MDMRRHINRQYQASLLMLKQCIEDCPEDFWVQSYKNPYWRVAYHTLFFTHLYASENLERFTPWVGSVDDYERFNVALPEGVYMTKDEILSFLAFCKEQLTLAVDMVDFEAPSGFHWLPSDMNKFELQLYNLRHLQGHVGQLSERLRVSKDKGINWVFDGS